MVIDGAYDATKNNVRGRLANAVASLHSFTPGYPAWSPFPLKVQHPERLSADSTIIPNLVDQLISK